MDPILYPIFDKPEACSGKSNVDQPDKPCGDGPLSLNGSRRVSAPLLLDLLDNGMDIKEIVARYPQFNEDDIKAAIAYGSEWREL